MGDAMDMDMDIDDAAQPIFISAGMSTTRLRDAPSNSSSRTAGASMRRGSISMAMSWKNSLGTSYNLLRAGNGTLSGMFSTSPVGNTIFE